MGNIEEEFISTVSHELRTPLTSIRGFAQTLLSSWDKLDDNSKKKFIKIIEEQSNRLTNLVENMLSVSKLAKEHFVYKQINPTKTIEQIIYLLKNQYNTHTFKVNKFMENIPEIFVDSDKFQQIIMNLLENSIKYSVEEKVTTINLSSTSDEVIIEVKNFGIGIETKDYQKIFTKFSRIDNHLTRSVQGSGLGLYITKNLVEKMNGTIEVISKDLKPKNYSEITFIVKFPIVGIEDQARSKCNQ